MTVQQFINWMQEEITAGDEIEYIVGSYEIEIAHLQERVKL